MSQDLSIPSPLAGSPSYEPCLLCPHQCAAPRDSGATGRCGQDNRIHLALASLHFGEEPPLVGSGGSGTLFFSGCPLGCTFCQNHQISKAGLGREVATSEFSAICLALQAAGAVNINLVTGTHFIPGIIEGIALARANGLKLPVLWNTSGYERVEMVESLKGTVDVWLPDFKTMDATTGERYFSARDYPETSATAILAMAKGYPLEYDEAGLLRRGLIMRHLILPGQFEDSRAILTWFAKNLGGRALPSLMTQYTPIEALKGRPAPANALSAEEYERLLALIEELDLGGGFYQELTPGSEWLPDFARTNPFSAELARTIWHHARGYVGTTR